MSKLVTLAEELKRRYLHMDGHHTMKKLCDSGYSYPTRMEIVKSTTKKNYHQIMYQEAGGLGYTGLQLRWQAQGRSKLY